MTVSEVKSLTDDALRHGLLELVVQDRKTTVRLLIHLGEFDSRRLYRAEGYSCMRDYCMSELAMSEDLAYKRIWVARKARRFPGILVALNEGNLTLSAVAMLTKYLSEDSAQDLLEAAAKKSNAQVAELLAERFPRLDLETLVQALPNHETTGGLGGPPSYVGSLNCQVLAVRQVKMPEVPVTVSRVQPLAPQRHAVQFTIGQDDLELLRRAQDLLSHQTPTCDAGEVFVRALRAFVSSLEKRKYGATEQPRATSERSSQDPRHIPARVKRAVYTRDRGQCTYAAHNGHRCQERRFLEFDHIVPVARGGKSTVDNLRLRCRSHNRFEADQSYGADFMQAKIDEAQRAADAKKRAEEVVPWLQALGIRGDHAREAAQKCDTPDASLEERVKTALRQFGPRDVQLGRSAPVS
jgi:5-methylcytosine-specific restriction endonuclease McrA